MRTGSVLWAQRRPSCLDAPKLLGSILLVVSILLCASEASAQGVGDRVRLESSNVEGVPVHPAAGDASFVRWINGTLGRVQSIDPETGWLEIKADDGKVGWIVKRYAVLATEPTEDPVENELLSYRIGTWNLEWLKDGTNRGFPEYNSGGPTYGPRTNDDYAAIANLITSQLDLKILILNEINGRPTGGSAELDRLLPLLVSTWAYEIAGTGGEQRIAILYDNAYVEKRACKELPVEEVKVQNKNTFDRHPLACQFALRGSDGTPQNDLLVVGLHLASGQLLNDNHNRAMAEVREVLRAEVSAGTFPANEKDVLLGGDLNASRYDPKEENFWTGFDGSNWKFVTLSPADGTEYSGTRLAGVPLIPKSQIDYLLASTTSGGLGDELVQLLAEVHVGLASGGFDLFREHVSDHLPVTVRVRVVPDSDP